MSQAGQPSCVTGPKLDSETRRTGPGPGTQPERSVSLPGGPPRTGRFLRDILMWLGPQGPAQPPRPCEKLLGGEASGPGSLCDCLSSGLFSGGSGPCWDKARTDSAPSPPVPPPAWAQPQGQCRPVGPGRLFPPTEGARLRELLPPTQCVKT